MTVTKERALAAVDLLTSLVELVRQRGEITKGELYAICGTPGLEGFDKLVEVIASPKLGLIQRKGFLLTWVGPEIR